MTRMGKGSGGLESLCSRKRRDKNDSRVYLLEREGNEVGFHGLLIEREGTEEGFDCLLLKEKELSREALN